jgi:hypothetical protein
MQEIIHQLEEKRAAARLGGGEKRIAAQHSKGKLTARERLEVLLDEGTFEEWDMFVEHRCTDFKLNGNKSHYKNTTAIKRKTNIQFESVEKVNKSKHDLPFKVYPTTDKVYNSMLDIKRKLHLFTTGNKSKCYHAAGWFNIQQGSEKETVFCPKYIFIQRYPYQGPFKTEHEAKSVINN